MKMAGAVRTGGKGTVRRCAAVASTDRFTFRKTAFAQFNHNLDAKDTRTCRKKKAVHKTTSTDDKRLQNTLKRLGVNTIPGIEEVNIFMDETVIHFTNPKGVGQLGSTRVVYLFCQRFCS